MQWRREMIPWSESISTKINEIEEYSKEHNTRLAVVSDRIESIYNDAKYKQYREKILWISGIAIVISYIYSVFVL
jgi:hypothetical protein